MDPNFGPARMHKAVLSHSHQIIAGGGPYSATRPSIPHTPHPTNHRVWLSRCYRDGKLYLTMTSRVILSTQGGEVRKLDRETETEMRSTSPRRATIQFTPRSRLNRAVEGRRRCQVCTSDFVSAKLLRNHWRRRHPGLAECRNCGGPVAGLTELEAIEFNTLELVANALQDANTPRILFCGKLCCDEFHALEESFRTVGNPDTAPFSKEYTDQFDWNR